MFKSLFKSINSSFGFSKSIANTIESTPKKNIEVDNDGSPESLEKAFANKFITNILTRLDGFDLDSHPEFKKKLHNEATKFALEIYNNNYTAKQQSALNDLNKLMEEFEPENAEFSASEEDKRTEEDFLKEFISNNLNSLSYYFSPIYGQVEDGNKYVVTQDGEWSSKGKKKIKNASHSFAHFPGDDYPSDYLDGFHVLFDTTTWGSGSEGFVVTDLFVAWKELGSDPEFFYLHEIDNVRHYEDDKEIKINREYYSYFHSELNRPARICAQALKDYISQPALALKNHID